MPKIHPTAIVDPSAKLAPDVEVGPFCVIEADVEIGAGTRLQHNAVIRRYTTLGKNNFVDSFAVLGGLPQDLKFDPSCVSHVRIGDNNVFREGVTISRATSQGGATTVGNSTYWMAHAHCGHDSHVGNNAILINGSAMAGHTELGERSILSAHVGVHQFCWVGDGVMSQGNSIVTMHIPPYTMLAGVNNIVNLNVVGLHRWPGVTDEDRRQIKEAFNITYRSGLTAPKALEKMDLCTDWGKPAAKFRDFIRKVLTAKPPFNRGFCALRGRSSQDD